MRPPKNRGLLAAAWKRASGAHLPCIFWIASHCEVNWEGFITFPITERMMHAVHTSMIVLRPHSPLLIQP